MTRHGKNCTASSVYSYHERKRDAKVSGYGTLHARLGADSHQRIVDSLGSLTSCNRCKNPVITPGGYLFDREAILEYILAQKKDIAKRTKEWEKQNALNEEELRKAQKSDQDAAVRKFDEVEGTPAHPGYKISADEAREGNSNPLKRPGSAITVQPPQKVKALGIEGDISNMKGERSKQLPSFWIPELNPTASASKLEKPSQKVLCPLSGKPLKMKDLMEVKFTVMPSDDEKKSLIAAKIRYMCAVTHDALTNTTRCAYLKKSKSVVTWDVVEKLIRKDWLDPVNGEPMTEDDIIELQRGGTGYAATNEVKAKLIRPQLELQ
ncbi:nitric oxide synthase-interacting protein-like family protein [Cooperia oncophora]